LRQIIVFEQLTIVPYIKLLFFKIFIIRRLFGLTVVLSKFFFDPEIRKKTIFFLASKAGFSLWKAPKLPS
jgi:hypothetical protein